VKERTQLSDRGGGTRETRDEAIVREKDPIIFHSQGGAILRTPKKTKKK